MAEAAKPLEETLLQEKAADSKLNELALGVLNEKAKQAA
jgi:ferritin-like metal-binding protein YciE